MDGGQAYPYFCASSMIPRRRTILSITPCCARYSLTFGVLPEIVAVLRQLYIKMRACMLSDDGVCSDWLKVGQGLRQVYVLPSLLFNIFFAVVLTVVLQNIQQEYGHPRRAGAPEGTAHVGGTVAGYGLRMSSGVRYAVRG